MISDEFSRCAQCRAKVDTIEMYEYKVGWLCVDCHSAVEDYKLEQHKEKQMEELRDDNKRS